MANGFQRVRPGDLITSEAFNRLLDELESLGVRVTALEAGPAESTAVTIRELRSNPAGSPFRVGGEMSVLGSNFTTPAFLNLVSIGGVRVNQFKSASNDALLVFDIPDVGELSPQGESTVLVVTNAEDSTASRAFTLLPALVFPSGRVEVSYASPPILPTDQTDIEGGQSYVFTYEIRTFVDRDAIYRLLPTINAAGWSAVLLDENTGSPRANNLMSIPADPTGSGVPRIAQVRVDVPNQSDGTTGQLQLVVEDTSGGGQVNPGSETILITIGNPPPVVENRLRVSIRSLIPEATAAGTRVAIPRGRQGAITFNLRFLIPGTFSFSAALREPDGWQTPDLSTSGITVTGPVGPDGVDTDVAVILSPGGSAQNTDLLLTISSTDTNPDLSITYIQGMSATQGTS